MEGASALELIAEVSVALVGFTGVVAAFRKRSDEGWTVLDRLRFRAMLSTSVAALLLSLLPLGMHGIGLSTPVVWAASSIALALYLGSAVPLDLQRSVRIGALRDMRFGRVFPWLLGTLAAGAALLQVLNALGIVFEQEAGPFILGLIFLIAICALTFTRLLSLDELPADGGTRE